MLLLSSLGARPHIVQASHGVVQALGSDQICLNLGDRKLPCLNGERESGILKSRKRFVRDPIGFLLHLSPWAYYASCVS